MRRKKAHLIADSLLHQILEIPRLLVASLLKSLHVSNVGVHLQLHRRLRQGRERQ